MNNMKEKGVKFITGEFPLEIRKENSLFKVNFKKAKQKNLI